jgi:tRNA (Thr-GGU) A37 N-methylase
MEAVCTIELDPRWAAGLAGLETVSHLLVLYWMDKGRRDLVVQSPRHYAERLGPFALRSPVRPTRSRRRKATITVARCGIVYVYCRVCRAGNMNPGPPELE